MTCRLSSLGVAVQVEGGFTRPGHGRVPLTLLELDAKHGVLGERVAGLFLAPYTLDCEDPSVAARIEAAASAYRARVAAEQAHDLSVRLGPLSGEVPLRPSYLAVSRMSLLREVHGARYAAFLSRPGALEWLDDTMASAAGGLLEPVGGGLYRVRPLKAREAVKALIAALRGAALPRQPAVHVVDPMPGGGGLLDEPWRLLDPPEGVVVVGCRGVFEAAERVAGKGVECRPGGRIASTLICEGPRGRVAVKEYTRMALKWLPAAALSSSYVRYRITPKSRMAAEYRYLRALRPVAGTPRVLLVCADYTVSVMAREFVEGRPVLASRDPEDWRAAGALLARIHANGYVVGDANPGNFVASEASARLIDAEQARSYTPRGAAWDLAVFSAYARVAGAPLDLVERALRAYAEEPGSPWPSIARLAASSRLWARLAVAPRTAYELRGLMAKLAGEARR